MLILSSASLVVVSILRQPQRQRQYAVDRPRCQPGPAPVPALRRGTEEEINSPLPYSRNLSQHRSRCSRRISLREPTMAPVPVQLLVLVLVLLALTAICRAPRKGGVLFRQSYPM
jgi:hypothetical protein